MGDRHEDVPNKRLRAQPEGTAGAEGRRAEAETLMLQDCEVDWDGQTQDPALQQALAVIKAKGQSGNHFLNVLLAPHAYCTRPFLSLEHPAGLSCRPNVQSDSSSLHNSLLFDRAWMSSN